MNEPAMKHFNPALSKCRHGQTFNEHCVECELVSLRALVRNAEKNIDRWKAIIAALEADRPTPNSRHGGVDDIKVRY